MNARQMVKTLIYEWGMVRHGLPGPKQLNLFAVLQSLMNFQANFCTSWKY
jgi:hypothetical protein